MASTGLVAPAALGFRVRRRGQPSVSVSICRVAILGGSPHQLTLSRNSKSGLWCGRNLWKSARIFYMPQSWDMGQILLLPLRRKAKSPNGRESLNKPRLPPTSTILWQSTLTIRNQRKKGLPYNTDISWALNWVQIEGWFNAVIK